MMSSSRLAQRRLSSIGVSSRSSAKPLSRTRRYASTTTAGPGSSRLAIGLGGLAVAGGTAYFFTTRDPVYLDSAQQKQKRVRDKGDNASGSGAKDHSFALQTNDPPGKNKDDSAGTGYISMQEVGQHHLAHDAWVVVDGKVYDVTDFHKHHPGGSTVIVANAGRDVTELFRPIHPPDTLEKNLGAEQYKGVIDPVEAAKATKAYEAEKQKVEDARAALPDVETLLSLDELQNAAESILNPRVVDYYGAAALDTITLQENRSSFRKCRLLPRVMRDVSAIEPQTTLFGVKSALPIYVSPASNALLGHPDGEMNITRGAARTGIIQGISAAASFSLTEILEEKDKMDEEIGGKMGMVYQVYFQTDRSKTQSQVEEAVAGGVQALLLTVDTNVLGYRQSTEKVKGTRGDASPGIRMGPNTDYPAYHDAKLNWDDLAWLKDLAKGTPIYLKGVCHIDDVRKAKEYGLAGCILSNHGGRQLDQARTGLDSLRSIHAEDPTLSKQIELYIDGGVRRGTDVLQAIAFGAKGVGLGRTFLWSQAAYGEKGVVRAIRIMEDEIIMAMRLLGVTKIDQITPGMVECLKEVWK